MNDRSAGGSERGRIGPGFVGPRSRIHENSGEESFDPGRRRRHLIRPRMLVPAAAAVLAYAVGLVAAWYETALLLGPLPPGPMMAELRCQAGYLASW